jgi:hypothetical protein
MAIAQAGALGKGHRLATTRDSVYARHLAKATVSFVDTVSGRSASFACVLCASCPLTLLVRWRTFKHTEAPWRSTHQTATTTCRSLFFDETCILASANAD